VKSKSLGLALILIAHPALALQFPCQNPTGKARVDNAAVVTRELFEDKPKFVVHFPENVEGRGYYYSELTIGSSKTGYVVMEPRDYQRTYGTSKNWRAINLEHPTPKLPLSLNIYYGANPKCRTTVHLRVQ
jgi:hypothetical protein